MKFLQLRTESALKKNSSLRASIPYSQAKSIGILFTVEDKQKHTDIKDFISQLEQDGKKVRVLEFLPKKKENYEFLFDFFSFEHLNFWGNLKSEKAIEFTQIPFDYLYNIDTESNLMILNLLARCKAHCRIGRYHETKSPYFEMMIEQNGTNKGLIETMYKYTKQLR